MINYNLPKILQKPIIDRLGEAYDSPAKVITDFWYDSMTFSSIFMELKPGIVVMIDWISSFIWSIKAIVQFLSG